MREFDKQKFLNNVDALLEQKNLKIGELEEAAGVSKGYLSRMRKSDSVGAPSIDTIWKMAQFLEVSVDLLLEGDFSNATDNMQYISRFLQKLIDQTNANDLRWTTIFNHQIQNALDNGDESLPIVDAFDNSKSVPAEKPNNNCTTDHSDKGVIEDGSLGLFDTYVEDNGYSVKISEEDSVYVFKVLQKCLFDEPTDELERNYIVFLTHYHEQLPFDDDEETGTKKTVLLSTGEVGALKPQAELLYQAIKRHERDVQIDDTARSIIDAFMKK